MASKHTYRRHKASNQAVVTLGGETYYLGPWESDESKAEYRRLAAEFEASGGRILRPGPDGLSVNEVLLAYVREHEGYYVKDGRPTSEATLIRYSLRPVKSLYGHRPANEFGPRALSACRHQLIEAGLARTTINRQIARIKRVFRWAVSQQLVEPSVYEGLRALADLRKGRSAAPERDRVKPAPQQSVDGIVPVVPRQVAAMIQLQLLTGMRPGEVTIMRSRDIERCGDAWTFKPHSHKMEHRDRPRIVFLGPKAQYIVRPFLRADPDAYLFSPQEAEDERNAAKRAGRVSPMTPSQSKRGGKRKRRRAPGGRYTTESYRKCIQRACDAEDVERFAPNQLRHSAGTRIRKEYDLETARAVLGHSSAVVTEIYAEMDATRAARVMADSG